MSIYEVSDTGYGDLQVGFKSDVILVTGPRCVLSDEPNGSSIVCVEHEICQTVEVSNHSSNQISRLFRKGSKLGTPKEEQATELQQLQHVSYSDAFESSQSYDDARCSSVLSDGSDEDIYEHDNRYEINGQLLSESVADTTKEVTTNRRIPPTTNGLIYLLGKKYHPEFDYDRRRSDENALFWFTYRCDFPSMDPYGITSDAGWGCMLRASQMLLAQTFRMHYKGRDWRPPSNQNQNAISLKRSDPFMRSLLTWFADFPSPSSYGSDDCFYSLHNMVAIGLSKYDKLPGEWYGPGTACYVLRDLVHRHEAICEQSRSRRYITEECSERAGSTSSSSNKLFRVYVASSQGTVYKDEIFKLMTRDNQHIKEKKTVRTTTLLSHPLEISSWVTEIPASMSPQQNASWDTALLLLIPLRLGLKSFCADYVGALSHVFSLPQSVGVLGGRPRGARWFVGAHTNANNVTHVLGLDPHSVQTAPRKRFSTVNGITKYVVDLSEEFLQSVHTTFIETFCLDKLDPSVALGFYCRNHSDLDNLFTNLQLWRQAHPNVPELFHIENISPNYENDDMDLLNDDLNETSNLLDDVDTAAKDDESDDDDYVML